jgi:hypothetical protein
MKRNPIRFRLWIGLLACAALSVTGCGGPSPPKAADPDQARLALRLTLDTWQKGAAVTSLKEREQPIHVVDHQWRDGYQLVRYQLGSEGQLGAHLRCQVQLSLKNAKGQPLHKKAVYSVGTSPVLTVVREEDP